jgi:hypothetical protein
MVVRVEQRRGRGLVCKRNPSAEVTAATRAGGLPLLALGVRC